MYMLMARAHRYAIDYIEQAPVIVLAARTSAVFDFYIRPKMLEATERPTLPGSEYGAEIEDAIYTVVV
jgi:hypothetical protein